MSSDIITSEDVLQDHRDPLQDHQEEEEDAFAEEEEEVESAEFSDVDAEDVVEDVVAVPRDHLS